MCVAQLRQQLVALKQDIAEARCGSDAKKLESAAVRAARHDAAVREAELCSQLSKAQAAVREQIEKASRARRLHEREKRGLQACADRLAAQLEQQQQQHAAELVERQRLDEAAAAAGEEDQRRQQRFLDAELARLAAESQAQATQLQQQYGQATAAQAAAVTEQLCEAQAHRQELWLRCHQLEEQLATAQAQAEQAQEAAKDALLAQQIVAAQASKQEAALVAALEAAQQQSAHMEAAAAAAQAAAAESGREMSQQCAQELRVMQSRLLSLLATKEGTIAALQCQLQDVQQALTGPHARGDPLEGLVAMTTSGWAAYYDVQEVESHFHVIIPPPECAVTSWLAGWQRLADEQGCCEASPPTPHDHQQRRGATSVLRTMSSSSLLGSGCLVRAYSTATMTSDSPSSAASRPASSRLEVPQPLLGGSCACGPFSRSAPAQPAVAQLSQGPPAPLQLHQAAGSFPPGVPTVLAPSVAAAVPASPFAAMAEAVEPVADWWPEEDDWMNYLPELDAGLPAQLSAVTIPPPECAVTSWLAGWQRLADEQGCCEASPPTPHDHQQRRGATSVLRTMSSSSLLGSGCLVRAYSTATMTSDSPSSAASRPASSRLEVPQPLLGGSCACGPFSRSAPAQPAVARLSLGPPAPLQLHQAAVSVPPAAAVVPASPFAAGGLAVPAAADWWPEEDDWMNYLPELDAGLSAQLSGLSPRTWELSLRAGLASDINELEMASGVSTTGHPGICSAARGGSRPETQHSLLTSCGALRQTSVVGILPSKTELLLAGWLGDMPEGTSPPTPHEHQQHKAVASLAGTMSSENLLPLGTSYGCSMARTGSMLRRVSWVNLNGSTNTPYGTFGASPGTSGRWEVLPALLDPALDSSPTLPCGKQPSQSPPAPSQRHKRPVIAPPGAPTVPASPKAAAAVPASPFATVSGAAEPVADWWPEEDDWMTPCEHLRAVHPQAMADQLQGLAHEIYEPKLAEGRMTGRHPGIYSAAHGVSRLEQPAAQHSLLTSRGALRQTSAVAIPPSKTELLLAGWLGDMPEGTSPPTPHEHQQHRAAASLAGTMSSENLLPLGTSYGCSMARTGSMLRRVSWVNLNGSTNTPYGTYGASPATRGRWEVLPALQDPGLDSSPILPCGELLSQSPPAPSQRHKRPVTAPPGAPTVPASPMAAAAVPASPFATVSGAVEPVADWWPEEDDWMNEPPGMDGGLSVSE
ncbi:hypothetical protein ACK3TF_000437 [Chlorella vulgaris]